MKTKIPSKFPARGWRLVLHSEEIKARDVWADSHKEARLETPFLVGLKAYFFIALYRRIKPRTKKRKR